MNLIQEAFQRLFPERTFDFQGVLKYNKKLGDFNANIRLQENLLRINLNHKWKEIEPEIKIGLIQTLLLKMLAKKYGERQRGRTFNIELYNSFIKKIPSFTQKTKTEPSLEEAFQRVNQNYFSRQLEKPNLSWGAASFRKLACYNFHNDTVVVSAVFREAPGEVLDYLLYHELLHKKEKFNYKNNRNYFHTRKFRKAEGLFLNKKQIEGKINQIIRQYKRKEKGGKGIFANWQRLFN